ncbi:MAG: CidA/LrgA family protein [Verrucomicrobia bacterium]|nr:CidA/LrgA family protein [Verrucomicrobiota bacterium]
MERMREWGPLGRGLGILAGCWWLGDALRGWLGLVVPGGIVGLLLLLLLLGLRVVPIAWVERPAALLMKWLPLILLPSFVLATQDRTFLRTHGLAYVGTMVVTLLLLWVCIGWLAQLLFRAFPGPTDEPGPLTDAERALAESEEPR